jgi:hypothetical protein
VSLESVLRPEVVLFGESTGRVIVASSAPEPLLALAAECGVSATLVGETGGDRLMISGSGGVQWIDSPLERLHGIWQQALPRRLQSPTHLEVR